MLNQNLNQTKAFAHKETTDFQCKIQVFPFFKNRYFKNPLTNTCAEQLNHSFIHCNIVDDFQLFLSFDHS